MSDTKQPGTAETIMRLKNEAQHAADEARDSVTVHRGNISTTIGDEATPDQLEGLRLIEAAGVQRVPFAGFDPASGGDRTILTLSQPGHAFERVPGTDRVWRICEQPKTPEALWIVLWPGDEPHRITRRPDGRLQSQHDDLVPEAIVEDMDAVGLYVFDGTISKLTAAQLELAREINEGAEPPFPGDPRHEHYLASLASINTEDMMPGDEWWDGTMRTPSALETAAFFGLE